MRPILCFIFVFGLSQVRAQLNENQIHDLTNLLNNNELFVSQAYKAIKEYRAQINVYADLEVSPDLSIPKKDAIYQALYRDINQINDTTKNPLLTYSRIEHPDFFSSPVPEVRYDSIISVSEFLQLASLLDEPNAAYEDRVFGVRFDTIKNRERSISFFTHEYNKSITAVGRRMGRLIQMAILEDDDYVTPNSLTRLNLALTDFKEAEYNLRNELALQLERLKKNEEIYREQLDRIENKIDDLALDFNNQVNPKNQTKHFFLAKTDLSEMILAGYFGTFALKRADNYLDAGLDVGLVTTGETELVVQPQIGTGKGIFHFTLGVLVFPSSDLIELTGNVHIAKNNFLGGIGFNKTRFTIAIGWNMFR